MTVIRVFMGFVVFEGSTRTYFNDNTEPVVIAMNTFTGISLIISDSMIVGAFDFEIIFFPSENARFTASGSSRRTAKLRLHCRRSHMQDS
jgi:hypothetical protein